MSSMPLEVTMGISDDDLDRDDPVDLVHDAIEALSRPGDYR